MTELDHDPIVYARAAAEAIRALNHVTLHRSGYAWPGEVHGVIVDLHRSVLNMPQALQQARDWLQTTHTRGQVGLDQDGDADATLHDTAHALNAAMDDARTLGEALTHVIALTSHLTGLSPDTANPDARR